MVLLVIVSRTSAPLPPPACVKAIPLPSFDPEFVTALAARSPLGNPTVLGVLLRVVSASVAENGFRRWGFQSLLTDKEVPPTQRRHLPTDTPADPIVQGRGSDAARQATSIAPPGMG